MRRDEAFVVVRKANGVAVLVVYVVWVWRKERLVSMPHKYSHSIQNTSIWIRGRFYHWNSVMECFFSFEREARNTYGTWTYWFSCHLMRSAARLVMVSAFRISLFWFFELKRDQLKNSLARMKLTWWLLHSLLLSKKKFVANLMYTEKKNLTIRNLL